jgi:hypothetical protein
VRRGQLGLFLVLLALAGVARAEDKTLAVVVDRSGTVDAGDPLGEGRIAAAFAVALSSRPGERVVVFAPGVDPAVLGEATSLEGLTAALRTITGPSVTGGVNLIPLLDGAMKRGERVLLYTADELDVIDAKGHVPEDVLAKAKAQDPRPDRKAINEAARALILEAAGELREGKLLALRTPLPDAARSVSFLEALKARVVPFEKPLVAARALAKELSGAEIGPAVEQTIDEKGHATIAAARGSRLALLATGAIRIASRAFAIEPSRRAWIADADAPLEVEGDAGTTVAALLAPRSEIEYRANAWRIASGAIYVTVSPKDRTLALAARANGADLEHSGDGTLHGRIPAADTVALAVGPEGALPDPSPVAVVRPLLALAPSEVPLAGARTAFAAPAPPVPAELVPGRVLVVLARGKPGGAGSTPGSNDTRTIELARSGNGFVGSGVLGEGTWTLASAEGGDLPVELAAPIVVKPAPVLSAKLVEASKIKEGAAAAVVELAIEPALGAPAAPSVAASRGAAKLEGKLADHGRFRIELSGVEPGRAELTFTVPLERGAEAKARLEVELLAAPSWKTPLALGLLALGLVWGAIAVARKRGLEKRFGEKQLRGLGSNGKISYERYRLIDHRDGRSAAVAPPGATAVRIELEKGGRVRARALEGSTLTGVDGKSGDELLLVHETCFLVARGLYKRRWVFLDREPSAEELLKKYVEGAPSYDGQQSRDSDVFVILDERENMIPASQRLAPVDSAKLPRVSDVLGAESDEAVVVANSEEGRILDDESAILDPGSSDDTITSSDDTTGEGAEPEPEPNAKTDLGDVEKPA